MTLPVDVLYSSPHRPDVLLIFDCLLLRSYTPPRTHRGKPKQ